MLYGIDYMTVNIGAHDNPAALSQQLASVPGLEPRPDALGNMQSVYRLDPQADGTLLLTFPAAVAIRDVLAVVAPDIDPSTATPKAPVNPANGLPEFWIVEEAHLNPAAGPGTWRIAKMARSRYDADEYAAHFERADRWVDGERVSPTNVTMTRVRSSSEYREQEGEQAWRDLVFGWWVELVVVLGLPRDVGAHHYF